MSSKVRNIIVKSIAVKSNPAVFLTVADGLNSLAARSSEPSYTTTEESKDGHDKLIYPPNDRLGRISYVGDTRQGKPNGKGKLRWRSGDEYTGQFKNGAMEGKGTYAWKNGALYIGNWRNSVMDGPGGLLCDEANCRYEGGWLEGKMHGEGVYTWSNGVTYDGAFVNGNMHGLGVCSWPNGRRCEVEFANQYPVVSNEISTILWACFVSLTVIVLMFTYELETVLSFFEGILDPAERSLLAKPSSGQAGSTCAAGDASCHAIDAPSSQSNSTIQSLLTNPSGLAGAVLATIGVERFPFFFYFFMLICYQHAIRDGLALIIWKVAQGVCFHAGYDSFLLGDLTETEVWHFGLFVGCIAVCGVFVATFSFLHAVAFINSGSAAIEQGGLAWVYHILSFVIGAMCLVAYALSLYK